MIASGELIKRVVFGVLLIAIALFCTIYHPLSFYALLLIGALLMYAEWTELTKPFPTLNRFGGLVYVGIPVWSLIALRSLDSSAAEQSTGHVATDPGFILFLFAVVWATDIAAYFGGKKYGKRKLAPSISPGKTIEGLGFGVLAAAIVGAVGTLLTASYFSIFENFLIGGLLAVVSQAGDLFESWLKRRAGVKDSGHLIPGHGGILDRVDGLVFAAPVYTLLVLW